MAFKSLLNIFRSGAKKKAAITVVLQSHAVSIKQHANESVEILSVPVQAKDWQAALEQAFTDSGLSAGSITVILNSDFYQTYQIEKPKIPKEEWSVALPFLLKDLISDRVTDIVADGVALPNSSKIQAYVVNKSIINDLVKCCLKSGLELGNVVPEEEVWAHAQNELTSFMLLHRAKQEHFKIAAFHESSTAFQRSIRTVMAPITNTPSAALQYDGLALELQRSIDYLSSTFKQAHFGKLFILCDEEDQTLLAQELQERVSVQVVTLQQDQQTYAEVLASLTKPESTDEINLYPEHLKPKVDYFTLKNVVVTWAVLSTLLLGTYGVYSFQLSLLNEQLGQLSRESEALSAKQASLQQQVAKHVPTQEKLNAVARIKQDIENKQASLKAVGQFDDSQKLGYSGVMTSLSILGRNDISLSDIYIDSDNLNMSGLASRPQAVPNWINQFKKEHNLVGRTFETLTLGRNEDDIVTFELRAKLEKN